MSVFSNIEQSITGEITTLLQQTGNLISSISPIFATLFAIYLMLWVFNYWANGGLVEMGVDLIKKLFAWSLIIGFCFKASEYVNLCKLVYDFSGDLSSALTGGTYSVSAMDTNWNTIDNILDNLEAKGNEFGFADLGAHLAFSVYFAFYKVCSFLFVMVVFVYYITAKLLLLCCLMVGPLFLACFLFPATRQWAMNWVNQLWNFTVTVLLFVVLGKIQDEFFTNAILPVLQNMDRKAGIIDAVATVGMFLGEFPMILCGTIIFTYLASKIPSLASALTGGSAQVSGIPMRMATAHNIAKNTLNVGGSIMASPIRMVSKMLGNSVKPTK